MSKFTELASSMQFMMNEIQATAAKKFAKATQLQFELEKFQNSTVLNYAGGIFKVDQALIGFVNALQGAKSRIVLDSYSSPIVISDSADFLEKLLAVYDTASQEYSKNYKLLNRK